MSDDSDANLRLDKLLDRATIFRSLFQFKDLVLEAYNLGREHVYSETKKNEKKRKIFRRGKWRKLLKDIRCENCSLSCHKDVECNPIEDFLNKIREEVKRHV